MVKPSNETIYRCGSYSRLSKEDGDKRESDSISNQKAYIKSYAESHNLQIRSEYCDDGFSGVTFERPGFRKMLDDVRENKINCIIVKDLSRFGRNYIEAGRYIERIFPCMDVRFIAINDNYDSIRSQSYADNMILPFKNLLNDAYSRDISTKTKTSLEIKRKEGQFVSPFAPYGYKKSKQNKNQLEIDEPAAGVIRQIYHLKISGRNSKSIAEYLNQVGIPSPLAYKLENGNRIPCGFRHDNCPKWCATTIDRILRDETYYGHLLQGKSRRINYKVRKQIPRPREEWVRCECTQEPILSSQTLELMDKLKQIKCRQASIKDSVPLFSGLLLCGKCRKQLTRKSVGKYHYYGCYYSDKKVRCKGIAINENLLSSILLEIIRKQIALLAQPEEITGKINGILYKRHPAEELGRRLDRCKQDLAKYENLKASLYLDFHAGILNLDDYTVLHEIYRKKVEHAKTTMAELREIRISILEDPHSTIGRLDSFRQYRNVSALDRILLLLFFKEISLFPAKKLEIQFQYQDEWKKPT